MRTIFLAGFFFSFLFVSAQTKRVNTESVIEQVTVFTAGAQIHRKASVVISPGRSEIIFSGLSNQLEQQSLQLKADANITLLAVQTAKDFFSQRKVEQEEKNLLEKRSSMKEKLDLDLKLLDVYKSEEAMLVKNQEIAGQNGVKTADLREALDLHRQRLTEVFQKQLETNKRIQVSQAELEKIKAQLQQISRKRDSVNYSVIALIDARETRAVTFQLSYTIKSAGWYPAYDIRVIEVGQPLGATMNAHVFQESGETWKEVNLVLSTGSPDNNSTPSYLQPWMLGFYDPSASWMHSMRTEAGVAMGRVVNERNEPLAGATITVKGSRMAVMTDGNGFFKIANFPKGSMMIISSVGFQSKEIVLRPGYFSIQLKESASNLSEVVVVGYGLEGRAAGVMVDNGESRKKQEEIKTVDVITQYQPTTITYKIEEKYSIETDGKTTTIGIKNISIPALYDYYAAPKADPSAYLTAKILNWQDYDLQSGEVNLYFEGTFLGRTYFDLTSVPDTLLLALGQDNNVRVSRKLVKEFSAKKFIGGTQTESKRFEIVVRNLKKVPVNIYVQDQFPVSITKEIDINDTNASEGKIDKESGIIDWELKLQPGEEKKQLISYTVKYPKGRKVALE